MVRADLGPLAAGRTQQNTDVTIGGQRHAATVIELHSTTPEVWCHELAHAVDPQDRRDPVASEAFADTLGALLLAQQPANLNELDALTSQAEQALRSRPHRPTPETAARTPTASKPPHMGELPPPGRESLFVFASLRLTP